MTPAQVRMARAGLDWSIEDLAAKAGVRPELVLNLEREHYAGPSDTLDRIRAALEAGGIDFTDEGAPGVRLRPQASFIPTEDLNAENDD